mmetsp:Transcript_286/g.579  ORF Transcript_286/g.579 Transcript_286/m.579 type:complete len:377 (+) Transcript_286:12-1142(+)
MEDDAQSHKAAGNAFFKEKKYAEAADSYSKAIDLSPDDHVLYSNRSGAYAGMKKFSMALADAERTIELKRVWGKGYGRKGDALFGLKKFDEAIAAYKDGLTFDESATHLNGKIADCTEAKKRHKAKALSWGKLAILFVQIVLHSFIFVLAIFGSLPFVGKLQYASFYLCLRVTMLAQAIAIYNNAGMIKFNKEWAGKVAFDENSHFLFQAFIFNFCYPFMIANIPQLLRSAMFIVRAWSIMLPRVSPTLWLKVSGTVNKVTGLQTQLSSFNSSFEVMVGFLLLFEMLTPARNLMLVMMYWQYIRFRYMLSQGTKDAFKSVRGWVDSKLVHSSWCPSAVGSAWTKIADYTFSFVDPEQIRESASTGLASKLKGCSIM